MAILGSAINLQDPAPYLTYIYSFSLRLYEKRIQARSTLRGRPQNACRPGFWYNNPNPFAFWPRDIWYTKDV